MTTKVLIVNMGPEPIIVGQYASTLVPAGSYVERYVYEGEDISISELSAPDEQPSHQVTEPPATELPSDPEPIKIDWTKVVTATAPSELQWTELNDPVTWPITELLSDQVTTPVPTTASDNTYCPVCFAGWGGCEHTQ